MLNNNHVLMLMDALRLQRDVAQHLPEISPEGKTLRQSTSLIQSLLPGATPAIKELNPHVRSRRLPRRRNSVSKPR